MFYPKPLSFFLRVLGLQLELQAIAGWGLGQDIRALEDLGL